MSQKKDIIIYVNSNDNLDIKIPDNYLFQQKLIICCNKEDLLSTIDKKNYLTTIQKLNEKDKIFEPFFVSTKTGKGIESLKRKI